MFVLPNPKRFAKTLGMLFLSILTFFLLLNPTYAFQVLDVPIPPRPPDAPDKPHPPTPPDVPKPPSPPDVPTIPPLPGEPTPTPTPPEGIGGLPTPTPTSPPSQPSGGGDGGGGGGGDGGGAAGAAAGVGQVLGLAATDSLTLEAMAQDLASWVSEMGFLAPPAPPIGEVADATLLSEVEKPAQTLPVRIAIPKLNIDLPVTASKVVEGFWETSEDTASYGLGSGLPGEEGNTVIFAHNRWGMFASLARLRKDDEIIVATQDGSHRYVVVDKKIVDPTNTDVIAPTNDETLTLYTCTGANDAKRLVLTAKRV